MPSDPICAVTDCGNRDNTGRCTAAVGMFGECPLACSYGQFATIVRDHLGDIGEWKMREYADGLIKATLRGNLGVVEVWDGFSCSGWVYFNPKGRDKEPIAITNHWYAVNKPKPWHESIRKHQPTDYMRLRDAVLQGCAMAGIQTRMEV